MTHVRNNDPHTRVWNHLANAETGTTLELAPGEEADALFWFTPVTEDEEGNAVEDRPELRELPGDFSDLYLEVITTPRPAPAKVKDEAPATPNNAAGTEPPADQNKE